MAFLNHWLETTANVRIHGTTKRKPAEVFHTIEKAALKELTAEDFIFSDSAKATVHINCHLSYKANYYSVPFQYIGMELDVIEVNNLVKSYFDQKKVALHTLIRDAEGLFSSREPDLVKKGVSIKSDWYKNDKAGRKYKYDIKIWDEEGFTTWENVKKPLKALKVEETRVDHRGNPLSEPQITYILAHNSQVHSFVLN